MLDSTDAVDAANRSAVATAEQSATEAGSARTAAELFADAAQLAATERTTTWLDQLIGNGALTPEQRARVAAEDGAATLTRILRRVELAGHDPHQALTDAITASDLHGARNLANVLYARIRAAHTDQLDPIGQSFTEWTPRTNNPHWNAYLTALAAQVDQRAAELGRQAADAGPQAPGWAVEAFGPVPADEAGRAEWARQVGQVAAYREIRGHDNHTENDAARGTGRGDGDVLGAAPGAGQVEQYAAYRAAWRTLGRPEAAREVAEMTDGQLWIRVRAAQREEMVAPRYVANELAGTRQAADHQRRTAAVRDAEAAATTDPTEHERLREQAAQARALAATLDQQAEQLHYIDQARGRWLLASAPTRVEGADAGAELARRHQDDPAPPAQVTADEWLTAHRDAVAEDDRHRPITEADLADADREPDESAHVEHPTDEADEADDRVDTVLATALEVPEPDVREIAAAEPAQTDSDRVRVATAAEATAWTSKAHRALVEVTTREVYDASREEEERAEQLARWHDDTQHQESRHDEHGDQWADDLGPGSRTDELIDEREPAGAP